MQNKMGWLCNSYEVLGF